MKRKRDILARDTFLNVLRVHEKLSTDFNELFREAGLTMSQYNVLRILLGGPPEGAPCQYIRDHLLTRVPDVTRLVDRMESAGLVSRHRGEEDRRVVLVRVTAKGTRVCRKLDDPVLELHVAQLEKIPSTVLTAVNEGLERILALD